MDGSSIDEVDAYDVAIALGVFDYVDDPADLLARMGRAAGHVVGSFPSPGRGPISARSVTASGGSECTATPFKDSTDWRETPGSVSWRKCPWAGPASSSISPGRRPRFKTDRTRRAGR